MDHSLTEGSIVKKLLKLTLPIMGTSFVQMAYSLTDMFWIGFLGSKAVAAVGIGGFFPWLAMGFVLLTKIGTEISVAQRIGAKDKETAKRIAGTGITLTAIFALTYALTIFVFRDWFVGFFNTRDPEVDYMTSIYLSITCIGFIGFFLNNVFTGLFNATGNSRTPFIFNTVGLGLNILLDPILILGFGDFQGMGVAGAAIATTFAQLSVLLLFLGAISWKNLLMGHMKIIILPMLEDVKKILKMGLPPAVQSIIFTVISMIIARLIADFGPTPIAVQKVGSQIESITWMTASGFSVALGAFVGQNYGAGEIKRVYEGYQRAMQIAFALGLFNTLLLFFGAKWLFLIFIREPDAVVYGIDYLKILALSQLFMCVEITVSGIFNGLGHTKPPALIGGVFNLARIPMAIVFAMTLGLGINGIWWAITISSIFKGIIAYLWVRKVLKNAHVEV